MNRKSFARRMLVTPITCLLVLSLTGCAAKVGVSSIPGGARIIVDGEETSLHTGASSDNQRTRIILPQGKHEVTVSLEGYKTPLVKKVGVSVSAGKVFWLCAVPPLGAIIVLASGGNMVIARPGLLNFMLEKDTGAGQLDMPPPAPKSTSRYYRVYLKNGSIIAGQLISIDPVRGYVLRLNDNSEVVFPQVDVEKLVVE